MKYDNQIIKDVQEYYGSLNSTEDLKTNACCTSTAISPYLQKMRANIHEDVLSKYYGCGSPIPNAIKGLTILDLGCGTGVDCCLAAQLVGEEGRVIGVDMTENQIAVAKDYTEYHREKFGFSRGNLVFHQGYIEDLQGIGIGDESIDVVISNCVLNLSPDKEKVFSEIFRVLKPGGELYFSDVFSSRRIPEELKNDPVMLGECLGGAMYVEDFRRMLYNLGIYDHRVVRDSSIELKDADIIRKAGMITFHSLTVRAFKSEFEDICENYGHVAMYNGTIVEAPEEFRLDDHHLFPKGLPVPVCGNTATILSNTRFADHFRVQGDFSVHQGAFQCAEPTSKSDNANQGSCC